MSAETLILLAQAETGAPVVVPPAAGEPHAAPGVGPEAEEPHEAIAEMAHEGEEAHGAFPPFDPSGFASQLLWLAISFGLLYWLLSKIALPRIASILEERDNRIAADLAEAGRLKQETDAAIAAYEQALAEARQNAHGIAGEARDRTKAELDAERARIEADLESRVSAAEARIAEVKNRALADIDAIARDAASALVETLTGARADGAQIACAVEAARGAGR